MEEAVNKKADESKKKKRTSLKSILGGDILATAFFRRQTKLLVLIMVFIYVGLCFNVFMFVTVTLFKFIRYFFYIFTTFLRLFFLRRRI